MYLDDYKTCKATYVTLRVYYDNLHPNELTKLFQIDPSDFQVKGEKSEYKSTDLVKFNGWFLSSKNKVESTDSRRHLDYILDKILPIKNQINELVKKGAEIDLTCYWLSKHGHGGPTLSIQQLTKLTELGLDFSYDFY